MKHRGKGRENDVEKSGLGFGFDFFLDVRTLGRRDAV